MAGPKIYAGVSSKARLVSKIYVGVSSKARRVTKAYVGVSGKARLVYQSDFWSAGGIAAANCLAAYQFKGAASETEARKDLTGHGYTLTKYTNTSGKVACVWSAANGFYTDGNQGYWNYLKHSTLGGKAIKSMVIRYAGFTNSSVDGFVMIQGGGYALHGDAFDFGGPKYTYPAIKKDANNTYLADANLNASGVAGFNVKSAIYKNGAAMTLSSKSDTGHGIWQTDEAVIFFPRTLNGYKVYAAAFYTVNLTAAQHKAVSDAMLKL